MIMSLESTPTFENKCTTLRDLFLPFYTQELETFRSAETGYRMRAEFRIWHEGEKAFYAMSKPGDSKSQYIIENFEIGCALIQKLMPQLLNYINQQNLLKTKLFQVEFLTSTTGQALITLIYHRQLDDDWIKAANLLSQTLNCQIIGRSRKQKIVLEQDYIYEKFKVGNQTFTYQQIEASFTQPNAQICQVMLNWAFANIAMDEAKDLLELYCGNGNFTLPLSRKFNQVLATEISKPSIKSAKHNCSINEVNNIEFVRMSSEEITEALEGVRPFRRLQNIDLQSYAFSHVFVDPPRAGLDENTRKLVSRFDNIIYISCNPETLIRDLTALNITHKVLKAAFFDQFPNTHHCECGIILERRNIDQN